MQSSKRRVEAAMCPHTASACVYTEREVQKGIRRCAPL